MCSQAFVLQYVRVQGWNVYVHTGASTQQYNRDSFMPERWLQGGGGAASGGGEAAARGSCPAAGFMLPFGLGPRACLGRHLMEAALKVFVIVLIREHSWALANPEERWSVFPTVRPKEGLLVQGFQ
jgi:cytochrome P450